MRTSRRSPLKLLAGAAALALAACASGVRKPDAALPAAYEAPAGTQALSVQQLDRWWLVFGDEQLNKLEDQALAASPDAKTQAARLKEALATKKSAIFQTYPTGDLTGGANRVDTKPIGGAPNSLIPIGGVTQDDHLDFKVSWELDFLGALVDARNAARHDYAAARFNIEAARASLVANVADSYFQARGLAIQLADADEQVRIETELLRTTQIKADRGLGQRSDADRIAGDLAQARSTEDSLAAQQHAAQRTLLILVGRAAEPVENLPLTADVPDPPALPQAVPGQLLARRPDVRQADEQMRAQTLRTKLAKEELFPNITIQPALGLARQVAPGIGVIGKSFADLVLVPQQQTTNTGYWSVGANLDQPVLDIPRLLEDAKVQGQKAEEAVIAYEQAVQQAYGDAENAIVELASDERRIRILTDGEARARRAYNDEQVRYKMGLDDVTTLLSAEQTWRTDRADLTAERVQALRRAVQTYKALGGGWDYQPTRTAAKSSRDARP
ncbi:MAG TPA: TolC family protein [Caulobacteraceae bacterium]|jgi:NodT family efflux transporter outer membrane factor (OMF) lipoprotein